MGQALVAATARRTTPQQHQTIAPPFARSEPRRRPDHQQEAPEGPGGGKGGGGSQHREHNLGVLFHAAHLVVPSIQRHQRRFRPQEPCGTHRVKPGCQGAPGLRHVHHDSGASACGPQPPGMSAVQNDVCRHCYTARALGPGERQG